MTDDPKTPASPFKLTQGRIVLLVLGVLLVLMTASALFNGLGNYQQLKEVAQDAKAQQTTTSP